MADDELLNLEHRLDENLGTEAGHLEADIDAAAEGLVEAPLDSEAFPANRIALALALPVIGAAVMVGGVFEGVGSRVWAGVGGLLGVALALLARRIRRPGIANLVIIGGLFAIGLIVVIPTGLDNVAKARELAQQAAASGDVLRPPVRFTPGWQAIVGWLMGIVGFTAVWVGTVIRKPQIAMLVPLPIAAVAGISVPDDYQVASGIVVLVLFAVSLGLLSSARQYEEGARPPLSYELRKFAKSLPLIGGITVALIVASQSSFLFPEPTINPAEEPQKPKTVPLDEVEDRVLFEVGPAEGDTELTVGGPFRLGTLDVYDGSDWRLPAFNDQSLDDVDDTGIVDEVAFTRRGVRAEFKVQGLGGAALPGLPGLAGVVAKGPTLAYDLRTGGLRVAAGQAIPGLRYTVVSASLPKIEELQEVKNPIPDSIKPFLDIPAPPPAVQSLINETTAKNSNTWDRYIYLHQYVLENITATGAGIPVSVTPERAQEILGDTLEATPFEIVALDAMLARWLGVPSRIGYGFDCGTGGGACLNQSTKRLEVRPKHGASFPEVYFPFDDKTDAASGAEWLPVIGKPQKAKPTVGNDPGQQQFDPSILPSNDIAASIYLPELLPPASTTTENVKRALIAIGIAALLLGSLYVAFPAIRKALVRSRRRTAAREAGPRARVALAYAEWRDFATDFGFRFPTDTPLMFLDRFIDDAEHAELAWLTTRALWGDLQDQITPDLAGAAEELSRALRRRLSSSQPGTMRFVAAVSRLSLKHPYAPDTDLTRRGRRRLPSSTSRIEPSGSAPGIAIAGAQ